MSIFSGIGASQVSSSVFIISLIFSFFGTSPVPFTALFMENSVSFLIPPYEATIPEWGPAKSGISPFFMPSRSFNLDDRFHFINPSSSSLILNSCHLPSTLALIMPSPYFDISIFGCINIFPFQ